VRSFRSTLTLWYTVALAAAVLAFGVTITVLQRRASESAQEERIGRLASRLDTLLARRAIDGHGPIVEKTFAPFLSLRVDVLDQVAVTPGFVLVVSPTAFALFGSPEVKHLSQSAQDTLRSRLAGLRMNREIFTLKLDATDYRFVADRVRGAGPDIFAVTVGEVALDPQDALQRMGASLLIVVPIIFVFAALVGWLLANRALHPVGAIIDELEEITDGRSLHRRLPAGGGPEPDELGRLANALNSLLARLETSFAAMRRFVADASHELKTPLTVMRAGVERALTDQKTSPDALVPLEETLVGVRHMTELVESLLTLARVDEGRMELHTEPVDLGAMLAEAFETAQILGEQAGVTVTMEAPAEPVTVDADRGRIRQLVMNLVTNAVKYTPAAGQVWISLTATAEAASITVRDTGIGIAPGDVGRVFDRFWRADLARSRTGERPGIGLGLSISKWIAEAHGGSIGVTSRAGRGTAFTVTLPLRATPPAVIES